MSISKQIDKEVVQPGLSGSVGWRVIPHTKRLQVQSLVRAHTWVAGSISVRACMEGNGLMLLTSMFLCLSLKINEYILGGGIYICIYTYTHIKAVVHVCNRIFLNLKKERNLTICNNMDHPGVLC